MRYVQVSQAVFGIMSKHGRIVNIGSSAAYQVAFDNENLKQRVLQAKTRKDLENLIDEYEVRFFPYFDSLIQSNLKRYTGNSKLPLIRLKVTVGYVKDFTPSMPRVKLSLIS